MRNPRDLTAARMPPPEHPVTLPPSALLRATRRMLRPLVRLLIGNGVTFPVLADMLRGLFVEVAMTDLLVDPQTQTDSRISLLTGVHRKEIRRLRLEEAGPDAVPPVVTLGSQIMARWLGTPACLDTEGRPLPLPRTARAGSGEPSFEALVESVTTDVRARTVLDDWMSHGIVALDDDGRVRLNTDAFIPRAGSAEKLFYFARNLHDHIAAAAANIAAAETAPFVDRSVHYDRLPPQAAAALQAAAREAAQRTLLEINRVALDLVKDEAPDPAAATGRVNFGVFVYVDDAGGTPEAPG